MKDQDRTRFNALLSWSAHHGGTLHPSLEIYHDKLTKFSLRVNPSLPQPLTPPFTAVTCPAVTTLSYLNALIDGPLMVHQPLSLSKSSRTATFPPSFMQTTPPHVIGRFFLIHEYLKGEDSFWYPYICTLPQPESISSWQLPAFWAGEDVDMLEGTNAGAAVGEILENVRAEYKNARRVLREEDPGWKERIKDYGRVLYHWAFCVFTSRSFRPSLVLADDLTKKMLGDGGVEVDDFSVLMPVFDVANHCLTARYAWEKKVDGHGTTCCGLVCGDGYAPGEQVFNNYGMKTNAELLLGYGFVLGETDGVHNDYVHVRKRAAAGDGEEEGEKKKKKTDFLISLRPLGHPSSLVGRARPVPEGMGKGMKKVVMAGRFGHCEPGLVVDLARAVATVEELELLEKDSDEGGEDEVPAGLEELVQRLRDALSAKLAYDYQRLKEAEPEEVEDGQLSPNQALALVYRKQCEKVLVAALESLED